MWCFSAPLLPSVGKKRWHLFFMDTNELNKDSMDTKEEIKQIAYDFTTSKGDCEKLENRILSLFGVVSTSNCEHVRGGLILRNNEWFIECRKCGELY